jgi:hypothetical protein
MGETFGRVYILGLPPATFQNWSAKVIIFTSLTLQEMCFHCEVALPSGKWMRSGVPHLPKGIPYTVV